MCAIELCMQSRWKPALAPGWRPPSQSGWSLNEVPEGITTENIRVAWRLRTRKQNRNGNDAVNEMAVFLHANGVAITKAVRAELENHADVEWCMREPSRCHKRIILNAAKHAPLPPAAVKPIAHIAARKVSAPMKVVRQPQRTTGSRGCCGGGSVR